ncbi:hypothetical protein [Klebsiella variicola]|uniref:hypothetical protein n=1 Tax=Klebsiella variicola TaxID=244366 RepID=UPI002B05609F|nr:hypothetical protein [Klebsiella variicola]
MQVQETHCIESGLVFNVGAVSYRRRIMVPLLLALAPGGKSKAKHELFFNGNSVAKAYAEGTVIPNGVSLGWSETKGREGYIEANQTATIEARMSSSEGGSTPSSTTIYIGAA